MLVIRAKPDRWTVFGTPAEPQSQPYNSTTCLVKSCLYNSLLHEIFHRQFFVVRLILRYVKSVIMQPPKLVTQEIRKECLMSQATGKQAVALNLLPTLRPSSTSGIITFGSLHAIIPKMSSITLRPIGHFNCSFPQGMKNRNRHRSKDRLHSTAQASLDGLSLSNDPAFTLYERLVGLAGLSYQNEPHIQHQQ